jgi:hypothetical protein
MKVCDVLLPNDLLYVDQTSTAQLWLLIQLNTELISHRFLSQYVHH